MLRLNQVLLALSTSSLPDPSVCADDDPGEDENMTAKELKESMVEEVEDNIVKDKIEQAVSAAAQLEAFESQLAVDTADSQAAADEEEKEAGAYTIETREGVLECLESFMQSDRFIEAADPLKEVGVKEVAEYIAQLCGIESTSLKKWVKEHGTAIGAAFTELLKGPPISLEGGAQSEDEVYEYDAGEGTDQQKQLPKKLANDESWVQVDPGDEVQLVVTMDGNIAMDVYDHYRKLAVKAMLKSANRTATASPLVGLEIRLKAAPQTPHILIFYPSNITPSGDVMDKEMEASEILLLKLQDDRSADFKQGKEIVDQEEK